MEIEFLIIFVYILENTNRPPFLDYANLFKGLSEFTVFPRVDFGELLRVICCREAHKKSFGAVGVSVAIISRFTVFIT